MLAMSVSAFGQSGQSLVLEAQQAAAQAADQPSSSGPVRRVSMEDAVRLALEQNLGIRIQRIDPQIQDMSISQARGQWAPALTSTLSRNSQTQQPTSALAGGATSIDNATFSTGVGLQQTLPWGGSYTANWNNSRFTTTNLFSSFSPQLNSNVNVQYTQPFLRNFSTDNIRQQLESSKKTRELSDIQLQGVITQTMRNVRNAYWDLAYSIANLKAQQQSLLLSQQSLRDNQKRVEIGTMAPIDIVQAQAEVASNEQGVIIADAAIKTAQDNLRTLILDPGTQDFWNISFEPTDAPAFEAQAIDVDAAVRNALDHRSDIMAARNNIQQSDINIRYFRNQIMPDVNANVSYIATAAGGTQLSPVDFAAIASGANISRSIISRAQLWLGPRRRVREHVSQLDRRRDVRLPARHEHAAGEPRAGAPAVRTVADATEEPRDAGRHAGPRGRAERANQPAARALGARVARTAGEETRGRRKEAGGGHVAELLRVPGAARPLHLAHVRAVGDFGL